MAQKKLNVALAGNPNAGKTTIFNNLTGTRQKVGNWPGVTVEKKEGRIRKGGYDISIVDLPGTYSLTPFSIEEIVARNHIIEERPDIVVCIIDSSNIERSLYLATQVRELDCRVIFTLNMADVAKARGIRVDAEKLGRLLDLPVVETVGNRNEGMDLLLTKIIAHAESPQPPSKDRRVKYSHDIESEIAGLIAFMVETLAEPLPYNERWAAIKLLENDRIIKERLRLKAGKTAADAILAKASQGRRLLAQLFDDDPEMVMTDERYGYIAGLAKEAVTASTRQRVDISRNIDLVLTNRFLGFPIFILFIWIMFQTTFSLGAYPMEWIDSGVGWVHRMADLSLPPSLFKEMLLAGVISGVGSVIVFLPNILILFFFIAIFEDTGYMARAAFLMDRIMHLIGLHGKSFIPMLMGFGCSVPAIIATRTLESAKDRLLTILITPFMSCSARLPVYIILAGTFFAGRAGTVIFCLYLLGILAAIATGRLLRATLLSGEDAPFVMELPPYRVPMLKSLLIHMWDRSKMFLKKMGKVILLGSIVIWALSAFPRETNYSRDYGLALRQTESRYSQEIENTEGDTTALVRGKEAALSGIRRAMRIEEAENSWMGRIGKTIAPVFAPIGIDWRGSIALLSGFVAKEIVVSTMGILYAVEEGEPEALKKALLASPMTPLSAFSMMVFVLLYVPCLATVAAIRKETGSVKWAGFSILYTTVVAWLAAFGVYRVGIFLGAG